MDEDKLKPLQHSFKPPKMTNRQAFDLRKQAVLGQAGAAPQHHHLHAVQEDAMDSSLEECSKLSLASTSGESSHHAAGLRHKVSLGSWDSYWDSRQAVEVPGRCALWSLEPCQSPARAAGIQDNVVETFLHQIMLYRGTLSAQSPQLVVPVADLWVAWWCVQGHLHNLHGWVLRSSRVLSTWRRLHWAHLVPCGSAAEAAVSRVSYSTV